MSKGGKKAGKEREKEVTLNCINVDKVVGQSRAF